ncbi:hypothetical protein GCM10027051_35130 [Niabella terrae]
MFRFLLYMTVLILFFSLACKKNNAVMDESSLQISLATACGWCAPGDSLQLNRQDARYLYFPSSCSASHQRFDGSTNEADWKQLVALLDLEKFDALDLNYCNICSDGCDIRATVKQGNYSHSISYGSSDNEAVASIRPFLKKLEAIKAGYASDRKAALDENNN